MGTRPKDAPLLKTSSAPQRPTIDMEHVLSTFLRKVQGDMWGRNLQQRNVGELRPREYGICIGRVHCHCHCHCRSGIGRRPPASASRLHAAGGFGMGGLGLWAAAAGSTVLEVEVASQKTQKYRESEDVSKA